MAGRPRWSGPPAVEWAGPCHPGAHYGHLPTGVPGGPEVLLHSARPAWRNRRKGTLGPGTWKGRQRWGPEMGRGRARQEGRVAGRLPRPLEGAES